MKHKCLFAGTFDPFTVGHEEVVNAALDLFPEVVVALMVNPNKKCYFTEEERFSFLQKLFRDKPRVTVIRYGGLVADLAGELGIDYYIRGLRSGSDYDYETLDFYATQKLAPHLKVLYVPAKQSEIDVSSSIVRGLICHGKPYAEYLPERIREDVISAVKSRRTGD